MNEFYYLAHGGPGSGRYPWGSGDRPYQRLEQPGRRSGGIAGYIQSRKAKKVELTIQKQEAEKKKAEQEKQRHEADREKVIRSGSASDVLKYKGELSNTEYRNIVDRLDYEKKISDYASKEIRTNMQKVDSIMSNLKIINNWASIGTDTYNLMASWYNATSYGKKDPLTIVKKPGGGGDQNQGGGGKNKKKR